MRRALVIVAVAVASSAVTAAAIVLPASASGDEPWSERVEDFESCMRENGFDLEGDVHVVMTHDGVRVNGDEVDPEAFREAERECGPPFRDLLPELEDGELPELGPFGGLRDCVEAEEP